jgi:DNA polymerase-3 subunit gamma/tau
LRNLLVSRDAQTVALIEASDEVRQRYQQQAQKCKPAFLYAAIRLCTECDINYKQSQSKRLLVEITLIEIAQTAQEDVPSSGRRPKKILKPLFKQQSGEVQQQKVQKPQPVAASSPVAGTKPQAVPPVAAPKFQNGAVRLGSVSIRNMMSGTKPESINPSQTTANVVPEQIKSEDCKPIDSTSLLLAWRDFASSLPIDDTAMANRLKDITPVQVDDSCFEVTANNEIVEKELNQFKPRILQSLRLVLHNSKLEMNVRVRSQEDRKRVYNKMEMLSIMCKENQALSRLREVFGLQLD